MKINRNCMVSVIISTKNSAEFIEKCLESIKKQTFKKIEIILVDNNSSDETKKIAQKYTTHIFNKGPERSAQRNFGAKIAKGKYLLFIDSDMELSKDVVKQCIFEFENQGLNDKGKIIGGIIIPEKSIGKGFWAKCKALERSYYIGIDWIEAPRFFLGKTFSKFNGYDEEQTGTEDFDLPQRIKNTYGNICIKRINSMIYHNEGNLSLLFSLKKKFYYTISMRAYVAKKINENYFKKQASIMERYKLFFSNPKKLFSNPMIGAGMLFMKTAEFVAGGMGYLFRK
jgi:glycosyltransferase involved in cell wall biosynthesis